MGLQNLLLGLGTALVAIAVVVFTAVNWSRLDASVQGLLMVALTVVAAATARLAGRREMPSTSEALAMVAVLLGIADVHAVRVGLAPDADAGLFWAAGLALVSASAWVLGRAGRIRSPQIAASLLGQLPLLFVLGSVDASVTTWQLALVGQAAIVVVTASRLGLADRWVRTTGTTWALGVASLATTSAVVDGWFGEVFGDTAAEAHHGATAICLAAAAALALLVAWLRAESAPIRSCSLLAAAGLVLGAVWEAGMQVTTFEVTVAAVALAASTLFLLGRWLPKAWGEVPAIVAGTSAALLSLPLLTAVASMLLAASTVGEQVWKRSGSVHAASLQLPDAVSIGGVALALHLVAVVLCAGALVVRRPRVVVGAAVAGLGLLALVLAPVIVTMSITATVVSALAVVLAASAIAVALGGRGKGFLVVAGTVVVAYAWATPWSLATPTLTLGTLGVGIASAVALAAIARRDGALEAAGAATVWVAGATPLLAGLAVLAAGSTAAVSWAVASVAAGVVSVIGVVLLDPVGRASQVSRTMAAAVEATSLVAYLLALGAVACLGEPGAASVALGAGVIGFAIHATRPDRRWAGAAAAAELLVLTWLQLDHHQVALVEAYSLPLAAVLLGAGLVGERLNRDADQPVPSWLTFGPGLLVALAPTVWLSFSEPGSVRPLVGLASGALVLVGGVVWGKRALVDIGTATVVVLGIGQLAPVVGEIPNWATIGGTGIVLLAVGATFEQRRRDLKAILRSYSALT